MCTLHLEEEQVTVIQDACTCYDEEGCSTANPADSPSVTDAGSDSAGNDGAASEGGTSDGAASASNNEDDNASRDRGLGKIAIRPKLKSCFNINQFEII